MRRILGRYDLWGDTVNIASRMESHGAKGRVHMSAETAELLRNDFEVEDRGERKVKGKGVMRTYFLGLEAGAPTTPPARADEIRARYEHVRKFKTLAPRASTPPRQVAP